jgi:hypothetical protein
MQIDFHHTVTYVAARLAGFAQQQAETIAYAAQYVDDATSEGTIFFDNQALYHRFSSAHKMLDQRNARALANHLVWLPFHFLPGNGGLPAGQNPGARFIEKIVCRPDSPVARDMIAACIDNNEAEYSLHRLGIAMHVYADTWAHQGFAGVLHEINEVDNIEETSDSGVFTSKIGTWLRGVLDDAVPPLGHGRANIFPDMPFLDWRYVNGHHSTEIVRTNTEDFCDAADHLCMAMKRYIRCDADAQVTGIEATDMKCIKDMFLGTKDKEGKTRHEKWLKAIAEGKFSFGAEQIGYEARGANSWKAKALGVSYDMHVHNYSEDFLSSDWKMFHDAVHAHRFQVIHNILPRYGICAA